MWVSFKKSFQNSAFCDLSGCYVKKFVRTFLKMIIKKNYLLLKLLLFSKKVFHISSEIFKEFFPFFVEILPFVFGIPTGVPSKVCPCHIFLLAILQELLQKSLPNSFWYFTISFLKTVRWFVLGIPGIPSASPSEVLQGTI